MGFSVYSALLGLLTYTSQTLGSPTLYPKSNSSIPLPERLIHHWPNGTWVENISVRPNGNLLVTTSTPLATVYEVKEPWTDTPVVEVAYQFDEWADRLIGIGETTPDTYIVVGSRFYSPDAISSQVERTFCVMEIDFSKNKTQASARLVAWMPDATLLQSVAALPWDLDTVLISDQYVLKPREVQVDWSPSAGQVWRVNTKTGKYKKVLGNLSELNTTYAHGYDVGINGIKIRGNYLYWVNEDNGYIYKIQIQKSGFPSPGAKPEVVAYLDTLWDDFTFGPDTQDTIWATGLNAVFAVSDNGQVIPVVGAGTSDNVTFPGPTAAHFGKTAKDKNILYVTGNLAEIPTGDLLSVKLGGWVRAIDTTGFHF